MASHADVSSIGNRVGNHRFCVDPEKDLCLLQQAHFQNWVKMGNFGGQNTDCAMWRAVFSGAGLGWPGQLRSNDLLLPSWHRLPPLPNCLSGFAPNRDHNKVVFEALAQTLPPPQSQRPVLSLFCADPFLTPDVAERALKEHPNFRIVNFPALTILGQAFVETAGDVGIGAEYEVSFLAGFQASGRKVGYAIARRTDLEFWTAGSPDFWMVVPSFDAFSGDTIEVTDQLALCQHISGISNRPVVLMSPGEAISTYAATKAGASGLIIL